MAGAFITFEGIEGSGKTTVIEHVAQTLRQIGRDVVVTREPGGTAIGDAIRTILLDPNHLHMAPMTELLLYAASRAQHVAAVIRPALAAGRWVLCDRYTDATTAYQGAARKIPATTIRRLRDLATDGVEPHCTILLDLPVEVGLRRAMARGKQSDRIEREAEAFHQRVRNGYLKLAKGAPERIKVVDANRPTERILPEIMQYIQAVRV